MVRHGRLIGRDNFLLEGADLAEAAEATAPDFAAPVDAARQKAALIGAFVQQFYDGAAFIPALILVDAMPADRVVLEQWLAERRGMKVELRAPQRGDKLKLMELARENAAEFLRLQQAERAVDTNRQTEAVAELQSALQMERPPARIECYDISTLQG